MAVRQTGFAVIGSQNAQEAHDLAVASHIIARQTHTPVLHFYDGSVSDADGRLSLLGDEALQQLLSKYPATAYTEPEPVPVVEGQVDGEAGDSPPVLPEPVDVAQVYV
jgi:pyruvate/2-oxoacid:ferredoxin oxidoreductase alpha subunit